MKRYVETKWLLFTFAEEMSKEESHEKFKEGYKEQIIHSWHIKASSIKAGLANLTAFCDDNAYEVKGIIPITKAHAKERTSVAVASSQAAAGLGVGWGVAMIVGFVAIVQRVEDLDEEEFNRRVKARSLKKRAQELMESIGSLEQEVAGMKKDAGHIKSIIDRGVVEVMKGIFGTKLRYQVGEKEFKERPEAEDHLRGMEKQLESKRRRIAALRQRIDDLSNDLTNIKRQIRNLEAEK